MASPFEQTFLSSLTERKRKRCDILEGLEKLKNVSLSELSDLCSVLSKDDILWLLQAKVPNALRLAEIVRAFPSAMPKAAKNTLLAYDFKTFAAVGEIDREKFVNVLLFCTADQQKSRNGVAEMEILAPPMNNCIKCKSPLISVTVFSLQKVQSAMKLSCRCKDCKLNYGYSMFGNAEEGFHFYEVQRPYVEASDDVFLDRSLCLFQVSLANHAWVSFVGFAESFTEVVANMPGGFQRLPAELQHVVTKESVNRLDRKMVSSAFYWHEIESEIMERNLDWSFKGKLEDARDEFMKFIESKRPTENYAHPVTDCSQMCKERGCEKFVSIDGIWKLRHPHCLYPVKAEVAGLPTINYPNVCTEEPETQASAFCAEHSQLAKEKNIPTNLREFIHDYCKVPRNHDGSDPSDVNVKNAEKINDVVASLQTDSRHRGSSAAQSQGTESFISEHHSILQECESDENGDAVCNKDTGESQKSLRKWSRGLLHFVRGGGHIERWCPLYVSEGPGQVFLITLQYLLKRLEGIPESQWGEVIVSYDNMCNLDKLRVAKKKLPFPEPYDSMWLKVRKIVGRLHMRNHKDPLCKIKYGSDDLKEKCPHLNTPVAEQTFIWAGKFKKIMCAMPKRRFLFFYHRMVISRNRYIAVCYQENRVPEFPAVHGKSKV